MTSAQGDQAPAKLQQMLKKFEDWSTKTVAEHRSDEFWNLPRDPNIRRIAAKFVP
jgi:hypothetical protein